MDKRDLLDRCREHNVRFMRLQFTDILGIIKNVEIPLRQFEKALDGEIMFDGSSIEGFMRIEESDMYLAPGSRTRSRSIRGGAASAGERGRARLICDVYTPTARRSPASAHRR